MAAPTRGGLGRSAPSAERVDHARRAMVKERIPERRLIGFSKGTLHY
jgi:hypothetical protein